MKASTEYRMGTGASSMLLIFVVLCIVTLGVLSLMSAKADRSLTDRNIVMVSGYYSASAEAQKRIMEIDNALSSIENETGFYAYVEKEGLTYENGTLSFSENAYEGRSLSVTLSLTDHHQILRISRYTVGSDDEWLSENLDLVP